MIGIFVSVLIVAFAILYVIGVLVLDARRRAKGRPSIFLDECESEGHGRRLVRDYHKKYGKKAVQ